MEDMETPTRNPTIPFFSITEKPCVEKFRPPLDDVYEITQKMDDHTLFYLFVNSEPLHFEEARSYVWQVLEASNGWINQDYQKE